MQVARPVMDAECNGYIRYSKWAGSPWRNHREWDPAKGAKGWLCISAFILSKDIIRLGTNHVNIMHIFLSLYYFKTLFQWQ